MAFFLLLTANIIEKKSLENDVSNNVTQNLFPEYLWEKLKIKKIKSK